MKFHNRWIKFWLFKGGCIHTCWKYRRWKELRRLAETLPKAAWDEQQKEIDRLTEKLNAMPKPAKEKSE